MGLLNVRQHIDSCYSNEDGFVIYSILKQKIEHGEVVSVSFKGFTFITTSFINSAFIDLIEEYSFETFRNFVKIIDSPKSIIDSIKKRVTDYQKYSKQAS